MDFDTFLFGTRKHVSKLLEEGILKANPYRLCEGFFDCSRETHIDTGSLYEQYVWNYTTQAIKESVTFVYSSITPVDT